MTGKHQKIETSDAETVIYRIDKKDIIQHVSESWSTFAKANQGEPMGTSAIGRSLWDFIMDGNTRRIYQNLLKTVRMTQKPVEFGYRCDSPDTARHMKMSIRPWGHHGVEFRSHTLKTEPKDPKIYCDVVRRGGTDIIRMCSFCNKLEIADDEWVEITEALENGSVAFQELPIQVICKVCPSCDSEIGGISIDRIAKRDRQRSTEVSD